MAYRFLFIGKANAEIDRLTSEVAKVTKERDEAVSALESNTAETVTQTEALQASASAAALEVAALKVSTLAKDSELTAVKAELATAQALIANPPAQIVKIAAVKALEITGAQGQPPIVISAVTAPSGEQAAGSAAGLMAQLNAIKDPTARTVFFKKHTAAILAASRAERVGK